MTRTEKQSSRKDIIGIGAMLAGAIVGVMTAGGMASLLYGPGQFLIPATMMMTDFPVDTGIVLGTGVAVYATCLAALLFLLASIIPRVFLHGISGAVAGLSLWITLNGRFNLAQASDGVELGGVAINAGPWIVCLAGVIAGGVHRLLWTVDVVREPVNNVRDDHQKMIMRARTGRISEDDLVSWTGGGMQSRRNTAAKRMTIND